MFMPERLCDLVKACGKSHNQIAKDAGIGVATLRMAMDGRYTPSMDVIALIADYFNVSLDYFVGREDINLEEYSERFKSMLRCAYENSMWTHRKPLDVKGYEAPWPYNLLDDIYEENVRSALTEDQEAGLMHAIETLHPKEKEMIFLHYREEKPLTEIARSYNLTNERIRQIIKKAIFKLRSPGRIIFIEDGLDYNQKDYIQEKYGLSKRRVELMAESARLDRLEENLKSRAAKLEIANQRDNEELGEPWENVMTDLSVRSYNCLRRSGMYTVGQIIKSIENGSILNVRNLGRKSCDEIIRTLRYLGYTVIPAEGVGV